MSLAAGGVRRCAAWAGELGRCSSGATQGTPNPAKTPAPAPAHQRSAPSAAGPPGDLRITPRLDQRILLWGFKRAPSTNVKLAVKGPIGGADLSQFQFIQVRGALAVLMDSPHGGVPAPCALAAGGFPPGLHTSSVT
jgi:hypothetical protein